MIFEGNNFVDDRGILSFVNSFDFNGIKRFYQIKNHKINYIRAWHAHKNETKYYMNHNKKLSLDTARTILKILILKIRRSHSPSNATGIL